MYCKKCGKEVKTDVKFCPYCGSLQNADVEATALSDSEESVPKTDVATHETQSEMDATPRSAVAAQHKPKKYKTIIMAVGIIVIIAIIGVVIWLMSNGKTKGEIGDISFELDKAWALQEDKSAVDAEGMQEYINKDNDDVVCRVIVMDQNLTNLTNWQIGCYATVVQTSGGDYEESMTTVKDRNAIKYTYADGKGFTATVVNFTYNNKLYSLLVGATGDDTKLTDEMDSLIQSIKFTKKEAEPRGTENLDNMYYENTFSKWRRKTSTGQITYTYTDPYSDDAYALVVAKRTPSEIENAVETSKKAAAMITYNILVGNKAATLYSTVSDTSILSTNIVVIKDGEKDYFLSTLQVGDDLMREPFMELLDSIRFK